MTRSQRIAVALFDRRHPNARLAEHILSAAFADAFARVDADYCDALKRRTDAEMAPR